MAKNQVQFQQGYSLFEFMEDFGTEEKCEQALFNWRFPKGYVCRNCGNQTYCQLKCRRLLQCNRCGHQHSLTSGTLFASTKLALTKWFMAIHLLTQSKTGLSAMELKRQLGVNYDTAWKIKHKLLQAMKEADDEHPIGGIVQLDDVYWGGERRGGKRGRGADGKTPFVAAVALNEQGHPVRMKMTVVHGFQSSAIARWSERHIKPNSIVISDSLACFRAIATENKHHFRAVTGGNLDMLEHPAFKWVNTMIGNVKNSLRGSCHAIGAKHLPRHLAEYCYRFNNRFDLRALLPRLARVAVRTPPMPYRLLKLAEVYG
jgi:transposase-like protein